MHPIKYEELKPAADDLLVFIDDTGHETFAGNQGFYGLGGCVIPGGCIRAPQGEVERDKKGDQWGS
jgi:hypothetical protein